MRTTIVLLLLALAMQAGCAPTEKGAVEDAGVEPNLDPTPEVPALVVPPPATLTVGGNVQTAGISTYCWSKPQGEEVIRTCADTSGIATPAEPLAASTSPVPALLRLPLSQAPSHMTSLVFPVSAAAEQDSEAGGYSWWDFGSEEPTTLPLQAEQELVFDLPAGLHVVQIIAWWDGVGDVVYGFLLEVASPLTGEAQLAQETLLAFLDHLHRGRYTEAATLFGGSYEAMMDHNPEFDPTDHAGLLGQACTVNGAVCLGVERIAFADQPAPTLFDFLVEFVHDDGSPFYIELPEQPPQRQFLFTVEMNEPGSFRVRTPLVYGP